MSFARNLFTVSSLTIVSRLSGFVRDTMMAFYLGADVMADAVFIAQRLPNLFRSLFAEGAFSAAFVPLYTTEQKQNGTEAAQRFAGQALSLLFASLIPFSMIIMAFMPWVMRVLASGFEPGSTPFELAVTYSLITFPYLILISVTALQGGVLNSHGRFGAAAAAPISLNVVIVIALLLGHFMKWDLGLTMSWSFLLSGVVQMCWLAFSCYRAHLGVPLMKPKLTGPSKLLFKRIGPGAIGAGAAQVNMLLSTSLASQLPTGGVASLSYADRLNQLPLGIIGIAVGTTLLPLLSRFVDEGEEDKVKHYMSRAIEFCLMLGLPATIGFILLAKPIVQTLWEHGAFNHHVTVTTAEALIGYSFNIPAFLLVRVLSSQFFARHDTSTPVKVSVLAMITNVAGALLFLQPFQHIGITGANSFAIWVNAILLYSIAAKRKYPMIDAKLRKRFLRLLFCVAVMGTATYFLKQHMAPLFKNGDMMKEVPALSGLIGASGLIYAIMLQITGTMSWKELLGTLKKRGASKNIAKSDLASPEA